MKMRIPFFGKRSTSMISPQAASSTPVIVPLPTLTPFHGIDVPTSFPNDFVAMQWALDQMKLAVAELKAADGEGTLAYQRLTRSLTLWSWWWGLERW